MLTPAHSCSARLRALRSPRSSSWPRCSSAVRRRAPAVSSAPPVIPVAQPVEREVTDFAEYTGRTDAVESVRVRPLVTEELKAMPFAEERGALSRTRTVPTGPATCCSRSTRSSTSRQPSRRKTRIPCTRPRRRWPTRNLAQSKLGYVGRGDEFQLQPGQGTSGSNRSRVKSSLPRRPSSSRLRERHAHQGHPDQRSASAATTTPSATSRPRTRRSSPRSSRWRRCTRTSTWKSRRYGG